MAAPLAIIIVDGIFITKIHSTGSVSFCKVFFFLQNFQLGGQEKNSSYLLSQSYMQSYIK